MQLHKIVNELFMANTYIIISGDTGIVIDPGSSYREIIDMLERNNVSEVHVISTHGHIDHVVGAGHILNEFNESRFYIHRDDSPLLSHESTPLFISGVSYIKPEPDKYVSEGYLKIGGLELEIIYTPGHTHGSISILVGGKLFTGDTLFRESIGRTDLGGDLNKLIESIHRKLFKLPEEVMVYPGHGYETSIRHEKIYNPYVGVKGIYPYKP